MTTANQPSAKELDPGPCLPDFSPGDRIYTRDFQGTQVGTVTGTSFDRVYIEWDSGEKFVLMGSDGVSVEEKLKFFGKPLDVHGIRKGSLISRRYPGQERVYAEVVAYLPGELLSYWYVKDSGALTTITTDKDDPGYLEERMIYWELEA